LEEELQKIGKISFNEVKYEEIKKKSDHLEKMQEEIFVLKSEVKKIPQVETNISEISSDVRLFSLQIKETQKQLEELDFNKERYENVEKEYENGREQLQGKREDRIKKAGEFSQIEKEVGRIQIEVKKQREHRKKIKEMRREINNLDALAGDRDTGLLNDFKRYLISRIGPLLSSYASNFFAIFTGGKYNDIEIDENYEILIYDNGDKFTIERFSGGEEDLANLSLRLAISQLIAQRAGSVFQFIALDEIFGSQDTQRRRNVLQALGELSHQFSQILLITHIEDVKDSLKHIINVFEDGRGSSNVTIE
jgi:exonuclease SbcC